MMINQDYNLEVRTLTQKLTNQQDTSSKVLVQTMVSALLNPR